MTSDRPLGRSLVRLGALALGRSRAHRQDLWPFMAIDPATRRVRWRGRRLLDLVPLAQIVPAGLPLIAIIGSGPSLRSQHPDRLPPGSAILLNGAASLAAATVPDPLAVMVEDERFVFRHHAMLAALPPNLPLLLSAATLRAMAERGPALLQSRPVGLIDNLAKPVGRPRRAPSGPLLSRDPEAGVVITGTVATSALQVALAARPAEILLAGIDLGNAATQPRFYEAPGATAASGLEKGRARILAGFAEGLRMAGAQGTTLSCASPVSLLLDLGYPLDRRLEDGSGADHAAGLPPQGAA